jgi:hypothetical protein
MHRKFGIGCGATGRYWLVLDDIPGRSDQQSSS